MSKFDLATALRTTFQTTPDADGNYWLWQPRGIYVGDSRQDSGRWVRQPFRRWTQEEADESHRKSAAQWKKRSGEWTWNRDETELIYMKTDKGRMYPKNNWASFSGHQHDTTLGPAWGWVGLVRSLIPW